MNHEHLDTLSQLSQIYHDLCSRKESTAASDLILDEVEKLILIQLKLITTQEPN